MIGTGNYTDYIDDQVASIEKDFSSYVTGRMTLFIISTLIEGIIVVLLLIMIIISIIRPLKNVSVPSVSWNRAIFHRQWERHC